jgi:hypothetical protein
MTDPDALNVGVILLHANWRLLRVSRDGNSNNQRSGLELSLCCLISQNHFVTYQSCWAWSLRSARRSKRNCFLIFSSGHAVTVFMIVSFLWIHHSNPLCISTFKQQPGTLFWFSCHTSAEYCTEYTLGCSTSLAYRLRRLVDLHGSFPGQELADVWLACSYIDDRITGPLM